MDWQTIAAGASVVIAVGGVLWSRASEVQSLQSDRKTQQQIQKTHREQLDAHDQRLRELELKSVAVDQHAREIVDLRLAITEIQSSQFNLATGIAEMRSDINTLIRSVGELAGRKQPEN